MHALHVRMRRSFPAVGMTVEQVVAGDRWNEDPAFLGPKAAAPMAIHARCVGTLRAGSGASAGSRERRARAEYATQVDRFAGTRGDCRSAELRKCTGRRDREARRDETPGGHDKPAACCGLA